jgi:hypothetical protein
MIRSFGVMLLISAACAPASVLTLQSTGEDTSLPAAFNPLSCSTANMSTCEWNGTLTSGVDNYEIPPTNLLVSGNGGETLWGGTDGLVENEGEWVSFENSGWNFAGGGGAVMGVPDACTFTTARAGGCAPSDKFFEQFTDNSQNLSLSLMLYADDDVAVYLIHDGGTPTEIVTPSFNPASNGACDQAGTGMHGAAVAPLGGSGASLCTYGEQITDSLLSGTNILEFDVYQMMGSTYGVLWNGEVTGTNPPGTPEPASFALLGAGLVALGALKRKRVKKQVSPRLTPFSGVLAERE